MCKSKQKKKRQELLKNNNRRKKGWHRQDLKFNPKLEGHKGKNAPHLNVQEKTQLMAEVEMLRVYQKVGGHKVLHNEVSKKSKKYITRKAKYNPIPIKYLTEHAWGIKAGHGYIIDLEKKILNKNVGHGCEINTAGVIVAIIDDENDIESRNVIDDFEWAKHTFTAKSLYASNKVRSQAADLEAVDGKLYHTRMKAARDEFDAFSKEEQVVWEQHRREHLRKWSSIKETILRELRNNNSIGYEKLVSKVDYWCGYNTIRGWVQSRDGYKIYTERVVPLLSVVQKAKHLACGKRIRTNWGLGPGKYLWIHYDKKWFWGLVLRKNAKSFEGLDPGTIRAYHKSHISKVMAVCSVCFRRQCGEWWGCN